MDFWNTNISAKVYVPLLLLVAGIFLFWTGKAPPPSTPTTPAAATAEASAEPSLTPEAQFCLGEVNRASHLTRNIDGMNSARHALAAMRTVRAECQQFPRLVEEVTASIEIMSRAFDGMVRVCTENPNDAALQAQCR